MPSGAPSPAARRPYTPPSIRLLKPHRATGPRTCEHEALAARAEALRTLHG